MFKNQIRIFSVSQTLTNLSALLGKTSPEFKVMKFLLKHFYQNEILSANANQIASQLKLAPASVKRFLSHLTQTGVIKAYHQTYFLNTNLVLNQ